MEINKLVKKEKINSLCNFIIDPSLLDNQVVFIKNRYSHESVQRYILSKTNCSIERMLSSFKLVNLEVEKKSQYINTLSLSEKLKVELAISLILNNEQIILYQFDKYFMEKDLFFFKKLLKKLVVKYRKTIVLIDSDISFMLDFVDRFILLTNKNEVKIFGKDDIYNEELQKYIDIPPIIDFIKYVNKNKKRLNPYTDIKELIKEIYREV